jgi:hypothetical protein
MSLVNINNSHYSGNFGSNETNHSFGLPAAKSNIQAANSVIPGLCLTGGKKMSLKHKINNIVKMYKMRYSKRKVQRIKRTLRKSVNKKMKKSKSNYRRRSSNTRRNTKRFRGGYSQYQNNYPSTPTYSVGANLSSNQSALANPPPISTLSNCTNCVDNYNHYTNKGFSSLGH